MIPKLFQITKSTNHPVYAQYHYADEFYGRFHYHHELQVTFIKQGKGVLVCGNSTHTFSAGDVLVFGSELPHIIIGDKGPLCESISAYVSNEWLTQLYPDSNFIELFIRNSKRGILIPSFKNSKLFDDVLNMAGLNKIKNYISLLEALADAGKRVYLNQPIKNSSPLPSDERLNRVYHFLTQNFTENISLEQVAEIANMSPNAFCRYFKQHTQKTLTQFLIELRIESACKIISSENNSIEDACYRSGYNNFSNFARHFKRLKDETPSEFRKRNRLKNL